MATPETKESKTWLGVLAFFVVLALLGPTLLYRGVFDPDRGGESSPRSDALYYTTGEITELNAGEGRVFIAHEEIPGVMEAMTMPFSVRDASVLKPFRTGEAVSFSFRRGERGFQIDEITHAAAATP